MNRVAVTAVAIAIIACGIYLWSRPGGQPITDTGSGSVAATTRAEQRVGAGIAAEHEPQDAVANDATEPTTRTPLPTTLATIRGRLVDEDGSPLRGIPVALNAWVANPEISERYRLDHGEIAWTDPPPVVSDADGRFEHRFDPPPPYQFVCEPQAEERVQCYGRWGRVEPGATIDMGDVVLARGVEVNGRVVDGDGIGLAGETVVVGWTGALPPTTRPDLNVRNYTQCKTTANGFFSANARMPVGTYAVNVRKRVITQPRGLVKFELPRTDLLLVTGAAPVDTRPKLTGVVVDARGEPIENARLVIDGDEFFGPRTDRHGRFELIREPDSTRAEVGLGVAAAGFATWHADAPIAWDSPDLHVTLEDGPRLTIRVTRADDGAPVTRFGVQLAPLRNTATTSSQDYRLLHFGDHRGGILEIPNTTPGRFRLGVQCEQADGMAWSADQDIEIEVGVPKQIEVTVAPVRSRQIELVATDGEPVPDAKVELLWYRGTGQVKFDTLAMDINAARANSPEHVAVLVDSTRTDARGRATLRGDSGRSLMLRLPGPPHTPTIVAAFSLADDAPARIVVGKGGRIHGRIEPLSVFGQLRREAGLTESGPVDSAQLQLLPRLLLTRNGADGSHEVFPPARAPWPQARLADDGSFSLGGIPPGTWNLFLTCAAETNPGAAPEARGPVTRSSRGLASDLAVAEGEDRELQIDLRSWQRYPCAIRARVDGRPFAGNVELRNATPATTGTPRSSETRNLGLAEDRATSIQLPAGVWRGAVSHKVDGGPIRLFSAEFTVGPLNPPYVELEFRVGRGTIVLVGPDDRPVPGVAIVADNAALAAYATTRPTDADGQTTLVGAAIEFRLRARRKPLADDRALNVWLGEHGSDPNSVSRALVDLGTLDLGAAAVGSRTFRLPADWAELPR